MTTLNNIFYSDRLCLHVGVLNEINPREAFVLQVLPIHQTKQIDSSASTPVSPLKFGVYDQCRSVHVYYNVITFIIL